MGIGREVRVLKIYNGNFYCFWRKCIINGNNSNNEKLMIVNKYLKIDDSYWFDIFV